MARLVLAVMIVAALFGVAVLVALGLRAAVQEGDRRVREAHMEREGMGRVAFFLLIALIVYVAVTGGNL